MWLFWYHELLWESHCSLFWYISQSPGHGCPWISIHIPCVDTNLSIYLTWSCWYFILQHFLTCCTKLKHTIAEFSKWIHMAIWCTNYIILGSYITAVTNSIDFLFYTEFLGPEQTVALWELFTPSILSVSELILFLLSSR